MEPLVILIPCYNEALTVKKVVNDARRVFPGTPVYVYDNNSTDRTGELAKEAGAIVVKEPHQGKGNVIRSMFSDIDAQCYLMVDGDDTYPLEEGPKLVDAVLKDGVAMAIGDRLSTNYNKTKEKPFHKSGNKVVLDLINGLFGGKLKDAMTGFRAFSFAFAKSFPCRYGGFETETEMSIFSLVHYLKVVEIPILYRERPKGSHSKLNTFKDGFRVLKAISSLLYLDKPSCFFGIWSGIIGVIGLVIFLTFLPLYLFGGPISYLIGIIVGGVILVIALSLLIDSLVHHKKKNTKDKRFEENWNKLSLEAK